MPDPAAPAPAPAPERAFALPEGYDGLAEARRLLRTIRAGGLGTLDPNGAPFVSLVAIATDHDGAPILLLSGLSAHTRHIAADPRVSLLLADSGKGDPLAHPRLTLAGRLARAEDPTTRARLSARFLARNPKSALYADFPDFAFFRMTVERANLNGGFAKAASYGGDELLLDCTDAGALIDAEADALAHLNEDHAAALELYATALLGESKGRWRAAGLDPEGLDLTAGDRTARLVFHRHVKAPLELRSVLVNLAERARSVAATKGAGVDG